VGIGTDTKLEKSMDDNTRNTRNKECIEEIIRNTFEAIQDAYNYQTENAPKLDSPSRQRLSRIVFPQKRDDTTRISEQELRFVFVEQLNKKIEKGWDVFYAVETPTKDSYSGFSKGRDPRQDENGRSGEFDLVIFNNHMNRIALIEFKANNASSHDHKKDFVKLNNPKEGGKEVLRYLIEIVNAFDNRTLSRLHSKITGNESVFRCWSLKDGREITQDIIKTK
jgi:hypothetical protein